MTTTQKTKRPELVIATWPERSGAERFGDRRFTPISSCDSMWLTLRVVDDGSYEAYCLREAIGHVGMWIWFSTDSDSINIEFRAHDVHSATVRQVESILAELRRLNKRIPARLHGQSYQDYVYATVRAVGIKRVVKYGSRIGGSDEYASLNSIACELSEEIASRSRRLSIAA